MRQRVALVAWSALVLALAAVPVADSYRSPWTVALLALAALVPFGLVALGLALGVRRWAVAVAGVALGGAGAMVVLDSAVGPVPSWRTSPALEALGPLLDAVPRLLTAPRPAPTTPDLLAPALLLVWLVALVVALVVVPSRAARAAPLVGAAVLYAAGALLSAGRADRHGVLAVVLVLVVAAGWTLLPGRDAPAHGQGRSVALPLAATTVAAAFALVAGALPATEPFEPRAHVPPPQLPADASNPVPEVAAWNLDPDRALLAVHPGAQPLPERLALATLADFDGAAWTLDARLRAVGVVDTPLLADGARRAGSDLTVVLEQLHGVWLPSAGTTTAVDGAEVLMDVDTGSLVLPGGAAPGLTIHLTGERDAPTEEEVARAGVPPAAEAGRYLELPRLPEELRAEAAAITAGAGSRLEQALAIEAAVRAGRTHDLAAQSGSSYGRLMEFLFLPPEEAGQVGTAEQFSGAFAVLARSVGLPTRLVVGLDLARAAEDGTADGGVTVRGRHATIWAEVYFAGAGWVPFAPTPDESTTTPPQAVEEEPEEAGAEEPTGAASSPPEQRTAAPGSEESAASTGAPVALVVTGVAGGAVLLVLLALLGLRLVRRRRWQRAGAPGAWAQVLDALTLAGRPAGPGDTAPDVVATLDPSVREEALLLAARAEAAAFAPVADGPAGRGTSAEDWRTARAVERSLRRTQHRPSRLWWWFTPRVWRR
ncbi:transglutaminase-like domain-containing protein [Georgenia phoenicis]|uniref:transglutaminase domain-containing protein n=1 Tax=unclassified Georgenia TaxID=2626815 RepID=UPI0039AF926E